MTTDAKATDVDHIWLDPSLPAGQRVESLVTQMTLHEKVAQLYGLWLAPPTEGGDVAPHMSDLSGHVDIEALVPHGVGQLTRHFGSAPVDPAEGAASLARLQQRIAAGNRFGIPAVAHEECLAGFTAWGATAYPVPLSWGATFNPELVEEMSSRIAAGMKSVGVHQGLAPVLDVARDLRWGRVEETIGEDPLLVGTIATAYVRGLEANGIVATLKHFIGYSASKAGRNLAPVSMGPREFNDVMVPPFEMAVRDSGVRSVMHSYTDIDGVPSVADEGLLTGLLRQTWDFDGTVVADYFGVSFLKTLHGVAGTWGEAASQALRAGLDVELPTMKAFAEPLIAEIEEGRLDEAYVDRALRRVLHQKLQLGLLDPDWTPEPDGWTVGNTNDDGEPNSTEGADHAHDAADDGVERIAGTIDLDPESDRRIAGQLAEQAVVLVANNGILPAVPAAPAAPSSASAHAPAAAPAAQTRIAVVGPNADDALNLLGCYSFPGHVGPAYPDAGLGIEIPTVLDALRDEYPDADIEFVPGVSVDGGSTEGISDATAAAERADLVIAVLGDRPGLFGRGTSGEGCDAESLELPGHQWALLDAVLDAGTPVVTALVAGRTYYLHDAPERSAAIVQTFFPGEEGAGALAGVLSGRINPSGRLPVSIPGQSGGQPATYLAAPLAGPSQVSNTDPSARFGFGHGLGYSDFGWSAPTIADPTVATDGATNVRITVTNHGARDGADVVQLYLHDPVASVVRPVNRLIGYQRVELAAGESAQVEFEVPADLAAFTGRDYQRIVEPGVVEFRLGRSSADVVHSLECTLTGDTRVVDHTRALEADSTIRIGADVS
ncbi:beta-glucosidase family protein [Arthrobacter castelli]|uniref:beta-xylosidase/alpha-l-arabinosidase n=1 Tax=Arthrobacter castelli TaxID=271431 RepID=UPI00040DC351|nr:glycoside hydrolase family 3 N-terminal domain-containing protein [Arthrobacter castelli]